MSIVLTDTSVSTLPNRAKIVSVGVTGDGVVWDEKRKLLWVVGDKLYAFKYTDTGPTQPETVVPFPKQDTSGHDLYPTGDGRRLFVTTDGWYGTFDPALSGFSQLTFPSTVHGIKSLSQFSSGGDICFVYPIPDLTIPKPDDSWWTPTAYFAHPAISKVSSNTMPGSRFYKVRWLALHTE